MNNIPHDVPGLWKDYVSHLQKKGINAPRVVIHGGYGKRNMGDDAILHVLISRIREYLSNAKITIVCHGPENIALWYPGVTTCHFKSLGALKAILKSDIYIIGGGGIINKINTYSGFKVFKIFDMKGKFLFFAVYLAKIFGAKTNFYAIGATSFPDLFVKFLSKVVLSQADVVSARDPLSIQNIKQLRVRRKLILVQDPALSLKPALPEKAIEILQSMGLEAKGSRSRPLIGLNVRYVREPEINNENSLNETVRLVEYLVREKHWDVLFLPISQHPSKRFEDDLDFGRQVMTMINDTAHYFLVENYFHPRVTMALMGEMDLLILTRLHSVILSSKMKVPFFTISYDDKVSQFVKLIDREDMLINLVDFSMEKVRGFIDGQLDLITDSGIFKMNCNSKEIIESNR